METFILNSDQVFILNKIYTKRRNLLMGTFVGVPTIIAISRYRTLTKTDQVNFVDYIFLFLVVGLLVLIAILYYNKVWKIKQDIHNLAGYFLLKKIVGKSYFEHVNTYFIFFDDVKMPNKEVSLNEYQSYQMAIIIKCRFLYNLKLF